MKRIILSLMLMLTVATLIQAADRVLTLNDSINGKTVVIELRDTNINGKMSTDTLSIMTYDHESDAQSEEEESWKHHNDDWDWDWDLSKRSSELLIVIITLFAIFGMPVIVIFIVFFFRYKNRKARYRLVEQAMARGETIPANFFEKEKESTYTKGIRNVCSGIGLFIFLWALVDFAIGCIGLLIMFTGIGQIIIYRTQRNEGKEEK